MNIKDKYKPYNFSETKCFIIQLEIGGAGVYKIEEKLPLDMKCIKGIFITAKTFAKGNIIGSLSLGFNESILKTLYLPIRKSSALEFHSQPIKLNEEIKSNSNVGGFFISALEEDAYPIYMKIYLHYEQKL